MAHKNPLITESSVSMLHNAGFFSCCTTRLCDITLYTDRYKKLPKLVDSSYQFSWYKDVPQKKGVDITYDYFEHYENINLNFKYSEPFNLHDSIQFANYQDINYDLLQPIIHKYFSLSSEIKEELAILRKDVDFQKTCVLLYRGNDKIREAPLCKYEDFLFYAEQILTRDNTIKFLLQSDESEFFDFFTSYFPENTFYFKDKIRHMSKQDSSVDFEVGNNYIYSKYYLAITYLMSQCKYIICQSGNTSLWVALYRGHSSGMLEFNQGYWIIPSWLR
jgi:hypothetical protein